jgi:hypothetical protein
MKDEEDAQRKIEIIKSMKEFLHGQIDEKRIKTVQERFRVKNDESEKMKSESKMIQDEQKISHIEKMKKVEEYKKMLSEQIASKPDEESMNETEKKINKKILERIK